jgi:hypothetical protein
MPTARRRVQLVLEWADDAAVQWRELAPATRAELRALLRDLLREAARRAATPTVEGPDNE